jgi:hypothetical protein
MLRGQTALALSLKHGILKKISGLPKTYIVMYILKISQQDALSRFVLMKKSVGSTE